MDGDVESVSYLVVFSAFGETDEHLFFAVGKGGGVGFVAVGLEGVDHLVDGGFHTLEVIVEFDDAGELAEMLGFEVGGDEPDEAQLGVVVEFGAEGGSVAIIK